MVLTAMQGASTLMLPITASRKKTNLQPRYSLPSLPFLRSFTNTPAQKQNEETLKKLVDGCGDDSRFASMVEAIDDLNEPRAKSVKPYKTYEGLLTLGDPEKAPAVVEIRVERYFKTHLARPPAASTVVVKEEQAGASQAPEDEQMDGAELTAVRQARTYKVNDPDAPGGKRDVEFESLAKGYEYGRTAVHISESDQNVTKLMTEKSFKIVGFVQKEKVLVDFQHLAVALC